MRIMVSFPRKCTQLLRFQIRNSCEAGSKSDSFQPIPHRPLILFILCGHLPEKRELSKTQPLAPWSLDWLLRRKRVVLRKISQVPGSFLDAMYSYQVKAAGGAGK